MQKQSGQNSTFIGSHCYAPEEATIKANTYVHYCTYYPPSAPFQIEPGSMSEIEPSSMCLVQLA